MSGLRSPKSAAGAKASGPGSTHTSNAKPLAPSGAKASGSTASGGHSTHETLAPDRRAKAGAKASGGSYAERVTEHHRK